MNIEKEPQFNKIVPEKEAEEVGKEKKERIEKILELVEKINESEEELSFPGIRSELYLKMKEEEVEFPGYVTSVDEIIERFNKEGMKVTTGRNPKSGNIFILPADSSDIEVDSINPRHLVFDNIENEHLKKLITLVIKKI
jgi:hypothetical protein